MGERKKIILALCCLMLVGCHSTKLKLQDDKIILEVGQVGWGDLDPKLITSGRLKGWSTYEIIKLRKVVPTYREVTNE